MAMSISTKQILTLDIESGNSQYDERSASFDKYKPLREQLDKYIFDHHIPIVPVYIADGAYFSDLDTIYTLNLNSESRILIKRSPTINLFVNISTGSTITHTDVRTFDSFQPLRAQLRRCRYPVYAWYLADGESFLDTDTAETLGLENNRSEITIVPK